MVKIGDLELPGSMEWVNRDSWSPVIQESARTLGGQNVIWNALLDGGRPIDLEANDDVAWLTKEMVDALVSMASVPGGTYNLTFDDDEFLVQFRHQDSPAINFTRLFPHANIYNGSIKLVQV
ncbi:MAG: hypothetical protein HQL75_00255 [Magnetococcales bacterium]|nr:hypothetical protein [Magnetococcales bacterium]